MFVEIDKTEFRFIWEASDQDTSSQFLYTHYYTNCVGLGILPMLQLFIYM